MTNSTTNTELVDTLTDVFLTWMQNDILPFCVTTLDIIIIIVGVILNSILMVTFKQKGLMNEASTYLVLVLAIVDFIAYVSILLLTVIAAIAGKWLLTDPVCQFHGAMISWLMFANFTFLSVLALERGLKLCKTDLHDRVFEVRKYVYVTTGLVWLVSGIIAFLPIIGVADIKYEFFHQGCMLDYESSSPFLLVHFLLTVVLSLIIVTVSYGCIFNVRRHELNANRKKAFTSRNRRNPLTGVENSLPVIDEQEEEHKVDNNTAFVKTSNTSKVQNKTTAPRKGRPKKRPESPSGLSKVLEIFSDDHENPAFHLAITYVSLWACIMVCYLPYFVVAFYGTFSDGGMWRGFYTITLMITHVSFVVKPFIYLGHNRHYRSVTKETVPEAVMSKARSVRSSISGMSDKFEKFMFRSPTTNKGFGNVIATHKAILIWKTRMKMKEQNLKNRNGVVKDISNKSVDAESSLTSKHVDDAPTLDNKKVSFQGQDNIRCQPTTPSSIQITTSSYIENERQKLLASMRSSNQAPTRDTNPPSPFSPTVPSTSPPLITPTCDEELPGMIGGNDVTRNGSHSISPVYGLQNDQLRLI